MYKFILTLGLIAIFHSIYAVEYYEKINSPQGKIKLEFKIQSKKAQYEIFFEGSKIISNGHVGFLLLEKDSLSEFEYDHHKTYLVDESWIPVWGQNALIKNSYTEMIVDLKSTKNRKLRLYFRLYDDGFAFRYEIPSQKNLKDINIISEESRFELIGKFNCWWIWADYNTLEKLYNQTGLDSVKHVATPFTMKRDDGLYMSIHEASIEDYSTMTLLKESGQTFKVNLVPWSDGILVKSKNKLKSPWRAFIIGKSAAEIANSNLIQNLNEYSKIKDPSWIKPMTYVGIWWEMHLGISSWHDKSKIPHGATTENAIKYIDFAAENNIGAVLVEGWNSGWENWGKKNAFDFTSSSEDFDLKKVVAYAHSKSVEFIGHHETGGDTETYEKRVKKAFRLYKKLGVKAVKTGYAGPVSPVGEHHHGQCMVRHYNKVMKLAAKYHLMLDVHEPIILSGLSRTYPNLMTAEAVRGMEWNAWSEGNPPNHTCTLPFTRAIAGPIDYTAGIFDIDLSAHQGKRWKWNAEEKGKTAVHSTLSNQLALMIVLYSPLQMAADLIENYQNHPALYFIKSMPSNWDESRILDAEIGAYTITARRKGEIWYLAGICNEKGKELDLNLDFLEKDLPHYGLQCIDADNSHFEHHPEEYIIEEKILSSNDKLKIKMAPGGGFIMKLKP
jgi:alpha-glucosidase